MNPATREESLLELKEQISIPILYKHHICKKGGIL